VALAVVIVASVASNALPAAALSAADYGYPYPQAPDCDERTGASCVPDQWGFTQGQCHSWVAFRLNQRNAARLQGGRFDASYRQPAGRHWGGGGAWRDDAQRAGITVDTTPALGAVAWWSANGGHVAYVEAVHADGSIRISEMNADFHNTFDLATLRRGERWPDAFLHIADLDATGAPQPPATPSGQPATRAHRAGYWALDRAGTVYAFGDAAIARGTTRLNGATAIAARRDGTGYWTVDAAGHVRAFGTARTYGSTPRLRAGEHVTTIASTPSGRGYWLFTNVGRSLARGNATFHGDLRRVRLAGGIVASAPTRTGKGYLLVGADGGVFAFGDARFRGSTGGLRLVRPIVGIATAPRGYWLVASDGGIFAFGAPFRGSMAGRPLAAPVQGMVPYGNGYLLVGADGGIFTFSNRPFAGSLGAHPPAQPVVGVTAFAT
jgi:surface antigen